MSSYLLGMITIIYSLTGTVAHYPCVTGDRGDESSVESHHHNPIDEWLIVLGLVLDGGGLCDVIEAAYICINCFLLVGKVSTEP